MENVNSSFHQFSYSNQLEQQQQQQQHMKMRERCAYSIWFVLKNIIYFMFIIVDYFLGTVLKVTFRAREGERKKEKIFRER